MTSIASVGLNETEILPTKPGPNVVICIPAFNEEGTIGRIVSRSKEFCSHVVVCDDGSIDKTSLEATKSGAIVAAQYYQDSNVIRLGICDAGIGIRASMAKVWSSHTRADLEAVYEIAADVDLLAPSAPTDFPVRLPPLPAAALLFSRNRLRWDAWVRSWERPEEQPLMRDLTFLPLPAAPAAPPAAVPA